MAALSCCACAGWHTCGLLSEQEDTNPCPPRGGRELATSHRAMHHGANALAGGGWSWATAQGRKLSFCVTPKHLEGSASPANPRKDTSHVCVTSHPLEKLHVPPAAIRHGLLMPRGSAPQEPFCLLELGNFLPAEPCHGAVLRSGEERHIVTPWETWEEVLEVQDIFLLPCGWSSLDRRDLYVGEENRCHHRAAWNWCLFPNEENYCNH